MFLFNLLEGEATVKNDYTGLILIGVLVVAFIVMSFFNSKKRKQEMAKEQEKKDSLSKGAIILTIGGIKGTVVSVNHDKNTYVLKTGKSEIELDKRSIYSVEYPEKAKPEKVEEKVDVKDEVTEETKEEKAE
ncbi:MAG: preprotein translocase subunit YajC [Clostridia bacterium]|nr:preprotein translocase subunit YajC [Clostridia bacterium]